MDRGPAGIIIHKKPTETLDEISNQISLEIEEQIGPDATVQDIVMMTITKLSELNNMTVIEWVNGEWSIVGPPLFGGESVGETSP